jgi:cell division protein FtsB
MVSDFNKKRNREFSKNQFLFQLGVVLFLAVAVVLVIVNVKIYNRKKDLQAQVAFYESQVAEIETNIQSLKKDIDNSDNPDYLEKIAYEQLGKQKPGEQSIIFIEPEEKIEEKIEETIFLPAWISGVFNWIKEKF